jgi:hypothetical protein
MWLLVLGQILITLPLGIVDDLQEKHGRGSTASRLLANGVTTRHC